MRFKYVIIEVEGYGAGIPTAFLFPENSITSHADVARALRTLGAGNNNEVLGAGFCWIDSDLDRFKVQGKSMSLNMEAKEQDAKDLNRQFFNLSIFEE